MADGRRLCLTASVKLDGDHDRTRYARITSLENVPLLSGVRRTVDDSSRGLLVRDDIEKRAGGGI